MTNRLIQAPDEIVETALGLSRSAIEPVVRDLNRTLATTYTYYHQIKKHHWIVEGPEYMPLHKFLDGWAADLLQQADEVAERITALGGYPISGPAAQQELSIIEMESEGIFGLRFMLNKDLADGTRIAASLRAQIAQAASAGDFGTEQMLKELLLGHETNVHHLEHFLGSESLTQDLSKA